MKRRISAGVILALLTGSMMLALPAQAHSFYGEGDCDGWTLHLDGTWNAYDITVDGVSIGLEQNPQFADDSDATERTFTVVWLKQSPVTRTVTVERILDCEQETTTTLPEETTTTMQEETTTTVSEGTTTTANGNPTTTVNGNPPPTLTGTFWSASSECQTLTAEWGDGIVQVDVYQRLPEGDLGDDAGIVPFTESGQVLDTSGAFADSEWILVPVTLSGYVAVPDEIHLFTEECTPNSRPPVETTTTAPELPFTGMQWEALVLSGMAFVLVGAGLVKAFKERDEEA